MKVAFVYEYKNDIDWGTPQGLERSFVEYGCETDKYNINPQDCNFEKLISRSHQYDLIFICKAGPSDSFDKELKHLHSSANTKIFMEFGDDIPPSSFFQKRKYYVDHIFTPDLRCHKKYLKDGFPSSWMPSWCDDSIFYKTNTERENICVTSCIGERPLLREFSDYYGGKFLHRRVKNEENTTFYNSGTFTYQFARWNELTRRIFEAGGCGNAVITNRIDPETGIYDLFPEDECVVYFSTTEEAFDKMNRLYEDDEYRNFLANNLYNEIMSKHRVCHRINQILNVFNK